MAKSTKTVVFIDPNVTDWQNLVNGVEPGSLVFILDPRQDSVRQITDKLAALTEIDSIQIISHGGEGSLSLGSTQLNSANLNSYSSQLQQWGQSLTATGDILLYGCDVAGGVIGKAFVQQMSQLTGADVAASDDLTGSAALGGDWLLEYGTGLIEAPLALQVQAMEAYNSVLPNYIVGGYIGSWNLDSNTPVDTPFNKLTHLFYSFADVTSTGTVQLPQDGTGTGDIAKLQQIKAQNPNLKIMLSIGGATENDFSSAAATVQSRANFAQSAIQLMKTNGFDGLDIDWEYPEANEDNNYIQLLAQLRTQINQASQNDGKQYLLTTALSGSPYQLSASDYGGNPYDFSPQDLKATSDYVDFINVMSYDYHGPWENTTNHQSALYKSTNDNTYNAAKVNTNWAIQHYLSAGVPATDIVLGIPLYGRTWTGVNAGSNNGLFQQGTGSSERTYRELYNLLGTNGYQSFWDNSAKVPYIYSSQTKVFSTYENNQSILGKTDYVKQQGLGGAFFWEITQDLPITNPDSLINVAATNLGINNVVLPTITLAVSPSSVLENGPNNLIYTFTRTGATTNTLTVKYNVAGTATFNNDYTQIGAASFTATTGTITFAAGSSTKTLTIDPTGDSTPESNETVALTLTTGTGYTIGTTTAVTGTITNDDVVASPSITLAVSPSSVNEDGTTNLSYTFTRTGATTNTLTVKYNVAGTATFNNDYTQIGAASFTATTGTITFAAGSSTKTLTIDPTADTTVESNETVALTLTTGTGYTIGTTTAVTGTITNDDLGSPTITLAVSPSSVNEDGTTNLIYTFTRTGATTNTLTVKYNVAGTATFSNDYTQIGAASFTATTGTITFAEGSSTKTLTIDPTADTTVESNETVVLTLASGTGYTVGTTTAVTGTITNDDTAGPLTLTGDATNNNLVGGSGNDTFLGLGGNDTLTGGLGADKFRFNSPSEGMDTITDFSKAQGDKIELFAPGFNSLVWTDGVTNALAPSVFSVGTSANSWTNHIIYNNSNGIVYFDADALGSGLQVALAQLSPVLNLTNQDFIVSWV
ncbi:glycosyl hydrolase family 18 protein [Dolichospermum circinale CS-541/06]|uniref:glycosyl hydrolase family 18 protein n=6 Tax=Dolichospermum circinale TaxID=109265 RepID=UPI00232F7187|nr:glycosyl hydrolase family 18 protein [Dolichospermum circinale]MDB9455318.1 glycosyl hydrolase family 18 protein [Dolichospermum circinale CS-541/06]